MLKIKDMNLNSVIRQGDTQPREYQLDTGNLNLNLANKQATIRLMTDDYKGIAYETTATVSSENKISFSIDDIIPAREYRLEITVDDYVFPSRATDGRFDIDPSSHGQEASIIQIIGKDEIVREVKEQIDSELEPFLGEIEQAELDRQAQEEARETAEGERDTAEVQRKTDHANRSAEFDGKADKVVLRNEIRNGDFSQGMIGWQSIGNPTVNINDGYITFIPDIFGAGIGQPLNQNVGDLTYTGVMYMGESLNIRLRVGPGGTIIQKVDLPTVSNFTSYSFISNPTSTNPTYLSFNGINDLTISLRNVLHLNLTQVFGDGNEPTKEEMDELIKVTGYIDGEYALNNKEMLGHLMKGIREKANKKQEEWITPTLLNGATGSLKYRKNSLGKLEFKGTLLHGMSKIAGIPRDYAPSENTFFVVASTATLRDFKVAKLDYTGGLYFQQPAPSTNFEVDFNGIVINLD